MSVEVRYHVIREGKEIAVYTSKKEADAHDKMLDIAAELMEFISQAEAVSMDDDILEELCIYLSKNRDNVVRLLKGIKLPAKNAKESPRVMEAQRISKSQDKESSKSSKTSTPAKEMEKAASAPAKKRQRRAGSKK